MSTRVTKCGVVTYSTDRMRRKHSVAIATLVDKHMWLAAAVFVQQLMQLNTISPCREYETKPPTFLPGQSPRLAGAGAA